MNQTANNLYDFLNFDKSATVIYIEDSYNAEFNHYIQSSYKTIVEVFESKNINFCYLPVLFQSSAFKEIVNYNHPFLNIDIEKISVLEIYKRIIQKFGLSINGCGFICLNIYNTDEVDQFVAIDNDTAFLTQLIELANDCNEQTYFSPRLKRDPFKGIINTIFYSKEIEFDSDIRFKRITDESEEFEREIRVKIELLKERGSLKLIGEIIEELQTVSNKISTLFITNDYRIFLKDYGMKEVVMAPLPKSVFLLFLSHPEGIPFRLLSDYHDELLSIYRNITIHENIDRAIESIRALTDPLNGSINEKCSRIRAAFLEVITDELAKNYYITGPKGEPKKIILSRNLVEFQP